MRFTPDNFLLQIKNTVTGKNGPGTSANGIGGSKAADGGIQVDHLFDLTDFTLLGASVAIAAFDTNAFGLKSHATTAAFGSVEFPVPRDYDEATDQFQLNLLIAQLAQVTDNNVKFTATPAVLTPGSNTVATTTAKTTAAVTLLPKWYTLDLSGLGLKRQQVAYIAMTVANNATAGDEAFVLAATLTYASTIVSYSDTDQLPVDKGQGNPLR